MISTIGSLVQETSNRWRWLGAGCLYSVSCIGTSAVLGGVLSRLGAGAGNFTCSDMQCALMPERNLVVAVFVGIFALAYAMSDAGFYRLPRPRLMNAVPVTWWRRWRPYWAAIAYGGALGLGITTRIPFGAFYVLCIWCAISGQVEYGMILMGMYGASRSLVIFPTSWIVYGRRVIGSQEGFKIHLARLYQIERWSGDMRIVEAAMLAMFAIELVLTAVLTTVLTTH